MQVQERRCMQIISDLLRKYRHNSICRYLRLTVLSAFICACPATIQGTHSLGRPSSLRGLQPTQNTEQMAKCYFPTNQVKKERRFKENRIYCSYVYMVKNSDHFISVWLQDNLFRLVQPVKKTPVCNFKPLCCMGRWWEHACATAQESEGGGCVLPCQCEGFVSLFWPWLSSSASCQVKLPLSQ